jgi:hypothetical protein
VLLVLTGTGCATATPPPQTAATQPTATQDAMPPPVAATPVAARPADTATASKPAATAAVAPKPADTSVASKPADTTVAVAAPKPAARAAAAPPAARAPAAPATRPVAPPRAAATAAVGKPPAVAPLDLDALEARLRATKAIGTFTKISLKGKVNDLLDQFRDHYQGKKPSIAELRQSYDLLMMKVLTLLQDDDQPLASAVVSSREAIWAVLTDEKKFAALTA